MPVWYRDDPENDVEIFRGTVWEMAQALDAAKQRIELLEGQVEGATVRIEDLEITCAEVREVVQRACGGPFRPNRPLVEDVSEKITHLIAGWKKKAESK